MILRRKKNNMLVAKMLARDGTDKGRVFPFVAGCSIWRGKVDWNQILETERSAGHGTLRTFCRLGHPRRCGRRLVLGNPERRMTKLFLALLA